MIACDHFATTCYELYPHKNGRIINLDGIWLVDTYHTLPGIYLARTCTLRVNRLNTVTHHPLCCNLTRGFYYRVNLTIVLLNCLFVFFRLLKLKLLTQFPASKDEKTLHYLFIEINPSVSMRHNSSCKIYITGRLPQTILSF